MIGPGGIMSENPIIDENNVAKDECDESELKSRREFLNSLGRWSAIIIGGAALGGVIGPTDSAAWVNGGGGWVNARGGGGGGSWVNRSGGGGGWINNRGGGGWINRN
jgi:hypothetical protein